MLIYRLKSSACGIAVEHVPSKDKTRFRLPACAYI